MNSDLRLAEFLDRCCGRYAKEPSYRAKLRRELAKTNTTSDTRRTAA